MYNSPWDGRLKFMLSVFCTSCYFPLKKKSLLGRVKETEESLEDNQDNPSLKGAGWKSLSSAALGINVILLRC